MIEMLDIWLSKENCDYLNELVTRDFLRLKYGEPSMVSFQCPVFVSTKFPKNPYPSNIEQIPQRG